MQDRFCLQMVSCGECGTGNVYSTEETVCGTWIDGKPIYRKVISGKLANQSGNGLIFANVSNLKIERMVNLYGNMSDVNNDYQITLQTSYNQSDRLDTAVNMSYSSATGDIGYNLLGTQASYAGSTAYVVIEYTKK